MTKFPNREAPGYKIAITEIKRLASGDGTHPMFRAQANSGRPSPLTILRIKANYGT